MEAEDDKNILQHLLHLEAEATALVEGAQAEADRRLAEGEKSCRASYDQAYAAEVAGLEAAHVKEIAVIRAEYKEQLEVYGNSLRSNPVDSAAFRALAEKFLLGEG